MFAPHYASTGTSYTADVPYSNITAETCALLTLLIRAMVKDCDKVSVCALPAPGNGTTFKVRVGRGEAGKILGRGGRTARSLRIILISIAKEHGENFMLDLESQPE